MKSGKNSKQAQLIRAYHVTSELELKKKELLQCSITLQSVENHNATLISQNSRMVAELAAVKTESDYLIRNQEMHIKILEDRNKTLLIQKRQIQIKYDTTKIKYDASISEFQQYKTIKEDQINDIKQHHNEQIFAMKSTQVDYENAISEFQKVTKQVSQIKQLRQSEQQTFKTHIANIERQKIQSIDLVKREMLNKACEMRNKALQIRKQQLQVTTRLTFLQNDQLVRELEYQSAKTEQILRRNTRLEEEVKQLKRCIEINQQVQKQIMKRNVVAKNVIASLNQEVKQHKRQNSKVQEQKTQTKIPDQQKQLKNKQAAFEIQGKQKNQEQKMAKSLKHKSQEQNTVQALKEYIRNLQKINQGQVKQIQQLKNDKKYLKKQIKDSSKSSHEFQGCDNIASLLMRFLDQIVRPLKNTHEIQVDLHHDKETIEALKDIHVDKWSTESVQKIVKLLLNALRPYLTMKVLKLPYFQDNLQKRASGPDYQSLKQNIYASKYIEAIKRQKNRSLDNIKSRSVSYMLDEAQKKKKVSNHRRISKAEATLEPVAKRFIKPHLLNRI